MSMKRGQLTEPGGSRAKTLINGPRNKPSTARRSRSAQTERQLLRTATWLFSERGFHGTGIRDIAEAAGVAVSGMYYYTSSKDELLAAVMELGLTELTVGGESALDGVEGPSARLVAIVSFHVAFHAANPRTCQVIDQQFGALAGRLRQRTLEMRDRYEKVWAEILESGVRAGEFVDRGGVARLALLQMCTGVAHWYHPKGVLSVAELCDRFADMSLAMVGARQDGATTTVRRLDTREGTPMPVVALPTEPRSARR